MLPLATLLGTSVLRDPGLLEGADVRALHDRLAGLRRPTVWSSHGDVIPELLQRLAHRGMDLRGPARCEKASTWVVEVEAGAAVSARYLPPPA